MANNIATLLTKRFIQRRDVKAIQDTSGAYRPINEPWRGRDILAHLNKEVSFGHYLLDQSGQCKFFAFDIDLISPDSTKGEKGFWCEFPDFSNVDPAADEPTMVAHECNPREAWRDRTHPSRPWLKYQLKMVASKLARIIVEEIEIPAAVAYSGYKGLHVYGFTGSVPAAEAREAAELVLALSDEFQLARGNSFFASNNTDPINGYPNISIEIFPKQTHVNENGFGNLMRLPLGRNFKSNDPTFFVDMKAPMGVISPHADPVALLEKGNPWL